METILKYLRNPMQVGVHNIVFTLDLSEVIESLKKLAEQYATTGSQFRRERIEEALERLQHIPAYGHSEDPFDILTSAILQIAMVPGSPKEIRDLFFTEVEGESQTMLYFHRKHPPLFHSTTMAEDIVLVEKTRVEKREWLFNATTIGDAAMSFYKGCLQAVPSIKDSMKVRKEQKRFSSRFVYRPYPLSVRLWLKHDISIAMPTDLKAFLKSAIDSYLDSQWRTSIVLSAIAVESVLADLYEEKRKTPAPDVPLGNLFDEVKKDINFPSEISAAVDATNNARIAAVHRSRFPVSDRDAVNALFGATNLAMYYCEQF
jgi:hypothetical protein